MSYLIVSVISQAVRKLHGHLKAVKEAAVERNLPQAKPITLTPQEQSLDEDLDEAAQVSLLAYICSYLLVQLRLPACVVRVMLCCGCTATLHD